MKRLLNRILLVVSIITLATFQLSFAETGHEAWLRYAPLDATAREKYASLPANTVLLGDSAVLKNAQTELLHGIRGMLGRTLREAAQLKESSVVIGNLTSVQAIVPGLAPPSEIGEEGYWLTFKQIHGMDCLVITAKSDRGVLYGVFALLNKIGRGESVSKLNELQNPSAPIRWVDDWDNLDGRIERGYGGHSIFFENGGVRADLSRVGEYARILASIGINGCSINNVNADTKVLEDSFLPQLVRVAEQFRPWGIKMAIAVDVSSPKAIGGLDTFDPLDPKVQEWWNNKFNDIYKQIPDFGGVVVKADSEDRPGPKTYGRTTADAANVIARALKPHGGIVFYRAFVYNHHLDWTVHTNDRAKAAYENFQLLDGKYEDNVIIQIKHGPIDFQVREPASPLFGALQKTNMAIEFQTMHEYTGQQRHLVYLPPMWKEVLDFDMHVNGGTTPVKDLVEGKVFHRPLGGFVAVVNVGEGANWLRHPMALANLYAFGKLAWNPNLSSKTLSDEWTQLTFGNDPLVVQTITSMQMASWRNYENYSGPLGLQTLTDIVGTHFGPDVEASERNGWGQWHDANHDGVGRDRTFATGTGYTAQYPPAVEKMYESLNSTPDDIVLFFHHVPYTYKLHSGKTVIQFIYDSHYTGAEQAALNVDRWKTLQHHIDDERYTATLTALEFQAGHAIVWRDAVTKYFQRISGIPDAKGKVGHYPGRYEAEAMQLTGYTPMDILPQENASGGKAVECLQTSCSAVQKFTGKAGWYEIDVRYYDMPKGESKFRIFIGVQLVDEWVANNDLPARKIGSDSSMRRQITGVSLQPGELIRIDGVPDGGEHAALDYIEIIPVQAAAGTVKKPLTRNKTN